MKVKKIVINMVLAYSLVISIFIFFSLYTIKHNMKNVENYIIDLSKGSVTQSQKMIDMYLGNIFESQAKLANDSKVNNYSFVQDAFQGPNSYKTVNIMNHLDQKDLPYDYYIIYKNSEVVIGTNTVFSYKDFYKFIFHYEDYNADEFWALLFEKKYIREVFSCANTNYNSNNQKNILFLHSVGYNFLNPNVVIMYIVNNEELQQFMGGYKPDSDINFLIADEDNNIISSLYETEESSFIENNDYHITKIPSEEKNFNYILLQPHSIISDSSNASRGLIIIFTLIVILVMVCIFVSIMFYSQKIYTRFRKNTNTLNEQLQKQIPYLREDFFRKILEGKFDSEADLNVYSNYINFDLNLFDFQLMLIKISPSTPLEFTEEIIKKINIYSLHIQNLLHEDCTNHIVHILSYDRIVVLVKPGVNNLLDSIEHLKSSLPPEIKNLKLNIGISNKYHSVYDVASSYSESQCALIYSMVKNNDYYIFYNDIKNNNNTYYFPVELSSLLINHTSAGNITDMEKIISKLIDENIINRNLSIDMIRLFVSELFSTVIKIRNHINIEDNNESIKDIDLKISEYASLDDIQRLNTCVTLLKKMCHYVKNKKCQYKKHLCGKIKDYIDNNYHNPDLSLNFIADKFNISETYASQLFKDYTNKTYTKYLQNIRLKKANQLLKTDMPIKTILKRIGYNSLNTFERAYKRTYGKTPSEYRRSIS